MAGPLPMNRLLQGDVGSGKTVVAVYAMLLAICARVSSRADGPDGSARRQHGLTLEGMLAASQGPPRPVDRRSDGRPAVRAAATDRRGRSRSGHRHAGHYSRGLSFARLGLVVIDEQHKFGVRQRAMLRSGKTANDPVGQTFLSAGDSQDHLSHQEQSVASNPHYLVMTATPIRGRSR